MGDIQYCGVIIEDFLDYMSLKYYTEDSRLIKSHIGFALIMLKDLIEIIEVKEDLDLDLYYHLNRLQFFKEQDKVEELVVGTLKGELTLNEIEDAVDHLKKD